MPYPQTLDLAKKVCNDENSSYMSKTFKTLTSLLFASAAAAAYVIFFEKKMEMKGEVGKNCKNRLFT